MYGSVRGSRGSSSCLLDLEKTRKNLVKEGKRQGLIKRDQYSKEGPKTRIEALRKVRSRQKDLMI